MAVARTGLASVLDQPIETLSKGFRRRVGLAQAILHDPEVLILDEPTDGLDPNQKHAVRALIRGMSKDKTIVISTHLLEEVEAACSRAVIINRGIVVVDGTLWRRWRRARPAASWKTCSASSTTPGGRSGMSGLGGALPARNSRVLRFRHAQSLSLSFW